jgi:riboflavin synthase
MFTGIITDLGRIARIEPRGDTRLVIECGYDPATIDIGASTACSGICLTVVERGARDGGAWFAVDASRETVERTTLGRWIVGERINLERALRLGDELGGHLVSGHVDGVGEVLSIADEGQSRRFVFRAPAGLARLIASKGSVALDGTSFTVNEVGGNSFGINVIPHTLAVTTWGLASVGNTVNIEIDLLARYVARLAEAPAVSD